MILIGVVAILLGCSQKQEEHADAAHHLHDQISVKTVEGEASGFDCAVVEVLCPSTHRAADFTTGIFTPQKEFYFIVNIPQSFMTQYFLGQMSVTGKVYLLTSTRSSRNKSIFPNYNFQLVFKEFFL